MTYQRVVRRNMLDGDYHAGPSRTDDPVRALIAGDLRRLEANCRDALHVRECARHVGITDEQARAVLDVFFGDVVPAALPEGEWRELYDRVIAGESHAPAAAPTSPVAASGPGTGL